MQTRIYFKVNIWTLFTYKPTPRPVHDTLKQQIVRDLHLSSSIGYYSIIIVNGEAAISNTHVMYLQLAIIATGNDTLNTRWKQECKYRI